MKTPKETRPTPPPSRSTAQRAQHKAHPASADGAGTGAPFDEDRTAQRRGKGAVSYTAKGLDAGSPVQRTVAVVQLGNTLAGHAKAQTFGQPLTTSRDNNVNARETAAAAEFLHARREQEYRERHQAEVERKAAARRDQAANQTARAGTTTSTATAPTGQPHATATAITLDTVITRQNLATIGCGGRWIDCTVRELVAEIRKQIREGSKVSPPRAIAAWVYAS